MKHLSARWLQYLHILYLFIDLVLITGFLYLHIIHNDQNLINTWGLTYTAIIFIGIHFIYGILVYPPLRNKNTWLTTLISQILFDVMLIAVIQASDYHNLYYRIAVIFIVGLSSILGVFVIAGEIAVNIIINLLFMFGVFTKGYYPEAIEWLFTAVAAISGLVGWLIVKSRFKEATPTIGSTYLTQVKRESNIILQSIADGVIVYDMNGIVTIINPAAEKLTEWPANDSLGIDINMIMKLTDESDKPLKDPDVFLSALKKQNNVSAIFQLTGQKGKKTIISLLISPILLPPNNQVAGAVAVFRDVTEQRKEEQQRADFISTASHEMRTPVAAIEGYLSLALNDKVSTIDNKARGFLEKAHESTQHLGKLFQDLLTSAKAEDGRLTNHPTVVEMGEFTEKLTEDLRFSAEKKNLEMEFLVGSNELIDASNPGATQNVVRPLYYVHVDPDRIREVITNLFDNAVKYTESGKISLGITGNNDVVQVYVRDTGPGIPPEDVPHLFQKFYRVDNSSTRTIGGTGLGLFICKKIVELYGGRIWVESKLKEGSTFYINMPRLTSQRAEQLKNEEAAQSAPPPPSALTSV